jgi:hypothetical protein
MAAATVAVIYKERNAVWDLFTTKYRVEFVKGS